MSETLPQEIQQQHDIQDGDDGGDAPEHDSSEGGVGVFPHDLFRRGQVNLEEDGPGELDAEQYLGVDEPLESVLQHMITAAPATRVRAMPLLVCRSLLLNGSPKMPAKMLPPAMPAVIDEATPANSSARAKTMAAVLPSSGRSICSAWASSVTVIWLHVEGRGSHAGSWRC